MAVEKEKQQAFLDEFKETETTEQKQLREQKESEAAAKLKEDEIKAQAEIDKKKNEGAIVSNPENDISDEELVKLLTKKGISISSLEDFKPKATEAEIVEAKEKRENEMLAYGLKNNKFKREDYDNLKKLEARKEAVILDELTSEIKAANPEISEEDLEDEIKEYKMEHLKENDPRRIRRAKELNTMADQRLKEQYSSIYNLPQEFDKYEQSEQSKYQLKRKVEAGLPVYKKDVNDVLEWVKKQSFVIEDKDNPENNISVPFEFNENKIKQLEKAFLSQAQADDRITHGYNLETMKQEAKMFLIDNDINAIVSHAAKQYNSAQKEKYINGRKNLIPKQDLEMGYSSKGDSLLDQFVADVLPKESSQNES